MRIVNGLINVACFAYSRDASYTRAVNDGSYEVTRTRAHYSAYMLFLLLVIR